MRINAENLSTQQSIIPLAGLVEESVVDGIGIRTVVFVQGCPHRCKGCHNPQSHPFSGGTDTPVSGIIEKISANALLSGITLSGGEPFCYPGSLLELSKAVHALKLNVWCYTGYTYEQLVKRAAKSKEIRALLDEIDVLVDGRYIEKQRDLLLKFRGSANQRAIDLKAIRERGVAEIILLL